MEQKSNVSWQKPSNTRGQFGSNLESRKHSIKDSSNRRKCPECDGRMTKDNSKSKSRVWKKVMWFTRRNKTKNDLCQCQSPDEGLEERHSISWSLTRRASRKFRISSRKRRCKSESSKNSVQGKYDEPCTSWAGSIPSTVAGSVCSSRVNSPTATGSFCDFGASSNAGGRSTKRHIVLTEIAREINPPVKNDISLLRDIHLLPKQLLKMSSSASHIFRRCQSMGNVRRSKSFPGSQHSISPSKRRFINSPNNILASFSPPLKQKCYGLRRTVTFCGKLNAEFPKACMKKSKSVNTADFAKLEKSTSSGEIRDQSGSLVGIVHFYKSPKKLSTRRVSSFNHEVRKDCMFEEQESQCSNCNGKNLESICVPQEHGALHASKNDVNSDTGIFHKSSLSKSCTFSEKTELNLTGEKSANCEEMSLAVGEISSTEDRHAVENLSNLLPDQKFCPNVCMVCRNTKDNCVLTNSEEYLVDITDSKGSTINSMNSKQNDVAICDGSDFHSVSILQNKEVSVTEEAVVESVFDIVEDRSNDETVYDSNNVDPSSLSTICAGSSFFMENKETLNDLGIKSDTNQNMSVPSSQNETVDKDFIETNTSVLSALTTARKASPPLNSEELDSTQFGIRDSIDDMKCGSSVNDPRPRPKSDCSIDSCYGCLDSLGSEIGVSEQFENPTEFDEEVDLEFFDKTDSTPVVTLIGKEFNCSPSSAETDYFYSQKCDILETPVISREQVQKFVRSSVVASPQALESPKAEILRRLSSDGLTFSTLKTLHCTSPGALERLQTIRNHPSILASPETPVSSKTSGYASIFEEATPRQQDVPIHTWKTSESLDMKSNEIGPPVPGETFKMRTDLMLSWFEEFNDEQRNIILKKILNRCDLPQMHLLSVAMENNLHKTCPPNCQDMLVWLPYTVTLKILMYLDPVSLCRCNQVNRAWNELTDNPLLWQRLTRNPDYQLSEASSKRQCRKFTLANGEVHWKKVVAERFLLQRNWLNGKYGLRTFEGHNQGIACVQFDDTRIVSGSSDKTIKLWDISNTPSELMLTLEGHSGTVRCLDLNGNRLVSGSTDRTIKVWDLSFASYWAGASCKVTMVGHLHTVRCLQADEKKLVSGSYDKTVKVWDLKTGECKLTLRGHTAAVLCVQFDDQKIVSGSYDKKIKVWDLTEGTCLMTLDGHQDAVTCLNLTHDGMKIITGSLDYSLKFWDLSTGKCYGTLDWITSEGHTAVVRCLQVDSWRIVSGGDDKTLKVWKLATGQRLLTLRYHSDGVTCMQFNDFAIVSGSYDRTVKLWDFTPKHPYLEAIT